MNARDKLIGPALATLVLLSLANPAEAQRRQTRSGFWLSLGGGFGSVTSDCSNCGLTDLTGTDNTGYLRFGGTLNRHLVVGVEFADWKSSEAGRGETRDLDLVMGMYYPFATAGVFLKGGLGRSAFKTDDGTEGDGWAVASGIGYDLRIFRNISITTEATYWFGSIGRLKDPQDVTVARDYTQNVFDVRMGLTIH